MLENGSNFYMPVAPANGGGFGNGFGGDGWWILLLLLFAGGWGNGFGGGFGGGDLYPWMNNSQNINNGFRDQMLNENITSIRDGVSGISNQLCNSFAAVEQGANTRQMANMQSIFDLQSALQNCCCENRAATADLKYTIATEGCQSRATSTANTQAILDKLCQLELDGYKRDNENLRSQLTAANFRESQAAQNAFIQQGFSNEVDALYNRLSNCPVPSTPVYGRTPIFTCNSNCGCGVA